MIYIFLFSILTTYLYMIESFLFSKKVLVWFFLLIPFCFLLFLIPALQDGIGTDYKNYYNAYYTEYINIFYNKGEYFIYFIYKFIRYFDVGPQSFFAIISLFNLIFIAFSFSFLKKFGYRILVVFFVWFLVTNYYHNQMNIIRQFVTVFSFPLLIFLLLEKRFFFFFLAFVVSFFSHSIFIVVLFFLALFFVAGLILKKKYLFLVFLCSFFFYCFVLPNLASFFIDFFVPNYSKYYSGVGLGFKYLLTKVFYIPVFLVFFYFYYSDRYFYSLFTRKHKYFELFISFFVITSLSFFLILFIDRFNRIYVYFVFFSIFPIYYVFSYFVFYKKYVCMFALGFYLFLPYLLKVFVFPTREFSFSIILF